MPPSKEVARDVVAALGHLRPADLTPLMVGALVAEWRKKYSANYAYNRRVQLQRLLAELSSFGAPPIKAPKVPYPAQRAVVMRAEELARLLASPAAHLRLFILLYLQCGLRASEAARVTPRSYNPEEHTVTVKVKGGKVRTAQVTEDVERLFGAVPAEADPDMPYLDLLAGKHISMHGLRAAWRKHRDACGIPRTVTAHDLRRSAATILYAATKDLRVPQQLLGHKRLASTLAYIAPLAPDEARRYVELLRFAHFNSETTQ